MRKSAAQDGGARMYEEYVEAGLERYLPNLRGPLLARVRAVLNNKTLRSLPSGIQDALGHLPLAQTLAKAVADAMSEKVSRPDYKPGTHIDVDEDDVLYHVQKGLPLLRLRGACAGFRAPGDPRDPEAIARERIGRLSVDTYVLPFLRDTPEATFSSIPISDASIALRAATKDLPSVLGELLGADNPSCRSFCERAQVLVNHVAVQRDLIARECALWGDPEEHKQQYEDCAALFRDVFTPGRAEPPRLAALTTGAVRRPYLQCASELADLPRDLEKLRLAHRRLAIYLLRLEILLEFRHEQDPAGQAHYAEQARGAFYAFLRALGMKEEEASAFCKRSEYVPVGAHRARSMTDLGEGGHEMLLRLFALMVVLSLLLNFVDAAGSSEDDGGGGPGSWATRNVFTTTNAALAVLLCVGYTGLWRRNARINAQRRNAIANELAPLTYGDTERDRLLEEDDLLDQESAAPGVGYVRRWFARTPQTPPVLAPPARRAAAPPAAPVRPSFPMPTPTQRNDFVAHLNTRLAASGGLHVEYQRARMVNIAGENLVQRHEEADARNALNQRKDNREERRHLRDDRRFDATEAVQYQRMDQDAELHPFRVRQAQLQVEDAKRRLGTTARMSTSGMIFSGAVTMGALNLLRWQTGLPIPGVSIAAWVWGHQGLIAPHGPDRAGVNWIPFLAGLGVGAALDFHYIPLLLNAPAALSDWVFGHPAVTTAGAVASVAYSHTLGRAVDSFTEWAKQMQGERSERDEKGKKGKSDPVEDLFSGQFALNQGDVNQFERTLLDHITYRMVALGTLKSGDQPALIGITKSDTEPGYLELNGDSSVHEAKGIYFVNIVRKGGAKPVTDIVLVDQHDRSVPWSGYLFAVVHIKGGFQLALWDASTRTLSKSALPLIYTVNKISSIVNKLDSEKRSTSRFFAKLDTSTDEEELSALGRRDPRMLPASPKSGSKAGKDRLRGRSASRALVTGAAGTLLLAQPVSSHNIFSALWKYVEMLEEKGDSSVDPMLNEWFNRTAPTLRPFAPEVTSLETISSPWLMRILASDEFFLPIETKLWKRMASRYEYDDLPAAMGVSLNVAGMKRLGVLDAKRVMEVLTYRHRILAHLTLQPVLGEITYDLHWDALLPVLPGRGAATFGSVNDYLLQLGVFEGQKEALKKILFAEVIERNGSIRDIPRMHFVVSSKIFHDTLVLASGSGRAAANYLLDHGIHRYAYGRQIAESVIAAIPSIEWIAKDLALTRPQDYECIARQITLDVVGVIHSATRYESLTAETIDTAVSTTVDRIKEAILTNGTAAAYFGKCPQYVGVLEAAAGGTSITWLQDTGGSSALDAALGGGLVALGVVGRRCVENHLLPEEIQDLGRYAYALVNPRDTRRLFSLGWDVAGVGFSAFLQYQISSRFARQLSPNATWMVRIMVISAATLLFRDPDQTHRHMNGYRSAKHMRVRTPLCSLELPPCAPLSRGLAFLGSRDASVALAYTSNMFASPALFGLVRDNSLDANGGLARALGAVPVQGGTDADAATMLAGLRDARLCWTDAAFVRNPYLCAVARKAQGTCAPETNEPIRLVAFDKAVKYTYFQAAQTLTNVVLKQLMPALRKYVSTATLVKSYLVLTGDPDEQASRTAFDTFLARADMSEYTEGKKNQQNPTFDDTEPVCNAYIGQALASALYMLMLALKALVPSKIHQPSVPSLREQVRKFAWYVCTTVCAVSLMVKAGRLELTARNAIFARLSQTPHAQLDQTNIDTSFDVLVPAQPESGSETSGSETSGSESGSDTESSGSYADNDLKMLRFLYGSTDADSLEPNGGGVSSQQTKEDYRTKMGALCDLVDAAWDRCFMVEGDAARARDCPTSFGTAEVAACSGVLYPLNTRAPTAETAFHGQNQLPFLLRQTGINGAGYDDFTRYMYFTEPASWSLRKITTDTLARARALVQCSDAMFNGDGSLKVATDTDEHLTDAWNYAFMTVHGRVAQERFQRFMAYLHNATAKYQGREFAGRDAVHQNDLFADVPRQKLFYEELLPRYLCNLSPSAQAAEGAEALRAFYFLVIALRGHGQLSDNFVVDHLERKLQLPLCMLETSYMDAMCGDDVFLKRVDP